MRALVPLVISMAVYGGVRYALWLRKASKARHDERLLTLAELEEIVSPQQ